MKFYTYFLAGLLCLQGSAWAQVDEESFKALQQQVEQLTQVVNRLVDNTETQKTRIAELEAENSQLKQTMDKKVSIQRAEGSSSAKGLAAFNPDIGVILDVTGQLSQSDEDAEGNDKISARELELVFGHDVDPYTRLDATVTLSDFEEVSLEEAYATYWGIPNVNTRLGRFRPRVGKATALHRDQLKTVDEPLVVQKYLGVEGLSRSGVEFSGFIPAPWEDVVTHEWIAGVMEGGVGEDGALFGDVRRRPSLYARLRHFIEFSDETQLDLGSTYLTGSSDDDQRFEVNALALDATLTHYLTPNNPLTLQAEAMLQDRDETDVLMEDKPWGFYALADYKLNDRFSIGGRYDWVEPIGLDVISSPRNEETAWTGYFTFHQSEYARWRLQYQHAELAEGTNDDRLFLQATFAIGVHKHAIQ